MRELPRQTAVLRLPQRIFPQPTKQNKRRFHDRPGLAKQLALYINTPNTFPPLHPLIIFSFAFPTGGKKIWSSASEIHRKIPMIPSSGKTPTDPHDRSAAKFVRQLSPGETSNGDCSHRWQFPSSVAERCVAHRSTLTFMAGKRSLCVVFWR